MVTKPGPNDLRSFILAVVPMWVVAGVVIAVCGPARLSRGRGVVAQPS